MIKASSYHMPCTSKFSEAMRTCIWVKIKAGMELTYSSQQLKLNFTLKKQNSGRVQLPSPTSCCGGYIDENAYVLGSWIFLAFSKDVLPFIDFRFLLLEVWVYAFKLSKGQVVHCDLIVLNTLFSCLSHLLTLLSLTNYCFVWSNSFILCIYDCSSCSLIRMVLFIGSYFGQHSQSPDLTIMN